MSFAPTFSQVFKPGKGAGARVCQCQTIFAKAKINTNSPRDL